MTLRTKLLLAYFIVAAIVVAVLHEGFSSNRAAGKAFDQATLHALPLGKALHDLRSAGLRIASSTAEYLFLAASVRQLHGNADAAREAGRDMAREYRLAEDGERELERALHRYQSLSSHSPGEDAIAVRDIAQVCETLRALARTLRDSGRVGGPVVDLLEQKERLEGAEMRLLGLIDTALAREELRISGIIESSTLELNSVRGHYTSLLAFLALAAIAIGIGVTTFVSHPMQQLIRRAALIERQQDPVDDTATAATGVRGERRLRRRSHDEVQELNHAFDAMEQRLEDSRQRLRAHQDDLANQIKLRTRDLEEALQRAESLTREARAASDAKAAFLANMSHEIRTPLNGVMGTAELLSHTELNAHQHELVQTVVRSGDNLLRIINDILDFSKIDAGRLDLDHAPFVPGLTMEEVVTLLAPGVRAKKLELLADIDPLAYASVLGDAGRLRQIVLNLISNAIKFTEQGEVALRARARHTDEGQLGLTIEIQDTGIGMTEEVQRRLFQPFSQADASTTRRFGGTGLGLAISRQLAELMHGTLTLASAPEQGTTITLEITLQLDTAVTSQPSPGKGQAVLLCMTHPAARQAAARQLHSLGFQVEAAATLQEAAEIAHRHSCDVIMAEGLDTDSGARLSALTAPANPEFIPIGPFTPHSPSKLASKIRFRFTKPVLRGQLLSYLRHRDKTPAVATREGTAPMPRLNLRPGHGLRILVAEDNAVNRMVALQMLKRLGVDAKAVNNGAAAVAAQVESPHHLILMDCQMPELDGYEATRLIRAHERDSNLRRTPIIALTANALKGDRERTLEAGMDDYLSKPVSMEALADTLEKWLSALAGRQPEESVS